MKNKRVKMALFEAGLSQSALAKALGLQIPTLCNALRFELSEEEQDKMLETIAEMKAKKSTCDGNTQA